MITISVDLQVSDHNEYITATAKLPADLPIQINVVGMGMTSEDALSDLGEQIGETLDGVLRGVT